MDIKPDRSIQNSKNYHYWTRFRLVPLDKYLKIKWPVNANLKRISVERTVALHWNWNLDNVKRRGSGQKWLQYWMKTNSNSTFHCPSNLHPGSLFWLFDFLFIKNRMVNFEYVIHCQFGWTMLSVQLKSCEMSNTHEKCISL